MDILLRPGVMLRTDSRGLTSESSGQSDERMGEACEGKSKGGSQSICGAGIQPQGRFGRCRKKTFLQNPSDRKTQALIDRTVKGAI